MVFAAVLMAFGSLAACKSSAPEQVANPADHTHEKAEETCFICDASKRDPKRLWCKEHSRYEDRCWECHPELRDSKRLYCKEHGVYEDECPICHPGPNAPADHSGGANLAPGGAEANEAPAHAKDSRDSKTPELFCNEHGVPEHQCGICQPQLAETLPVGKSLMVRLPSKNSAELVGLSFGQAVAPETTSSRLRLLGEVRYNGNRRARVSPLASGVVARINVDVGQVVEEGELLAVVNSPGVADAKADFLSGQAQLVVRRKTLRREEKLFKESIAAQRTLDEAQASHRMAQVAYKLARQKLLNMGFLERDIKAIQASGSSNSDLFLRAPFRGTIVSRSAVQGEAVDVGTPLFEVADLEQMWIEVALPEKDAARMSAGTPIEVSVRALEGSPVVGELTWISPTLDERTRMVRARGVLPNPEGALRNGMFADVTALVQGHPGTLLLPAGAVHRINDLPFVFVRVEPDLFAAQRIKVGRTLTTGQVPVLSGLEVDKTVVTKGSFSIKSAFLASRLGAGCTDD